ncbi:growth hormone secretagogue receptor type 1-like [Physella acuta]|uniref:growth hormone secretagogue receptor type 1-like n=1 Tax=Physella acuta TaxID=109671 RepID=UPI0027DCBEDD|nr:growth hormone secretagogue receptor type 1-like [Physella acuta]
MSGRAQTNTTTIPPDDEEILQQLMADDTTLLVVGPLILLVIGIPGNILTMKVLSRQLNKDKTFRIYLNSMCSFNIISLVIFFARNITHAVTGSELIIYSITLCVFVRWMTYTLTTITNWHLVVITGFRYFFLIPRTRKLTASLNPVIIIVIFSCFFCVLLIIILSGGLQFIDDDGDEVECRMNTVSRWFHFLVIVFAFLPAPAPALL